MKTHVKEFIQFFHLNDEYFFLVHATLLGSKIMRIGNVVQKSHHVSGREITVGKLYNPAFNYYSNQNIFISLLSLDSSFLLILLKGLSN